MAVKVQAKEVFVIQERLDREYDAYHWMQQIHQKSKKYPFMSVFEEELVRLQDDLRTHPSNYARILEDWLKWYDSETSAVQLPASDLILREGSAVLQEAIQFLRSKEQVPPLSVSKALCFAGQLHCHAAGKLGLDSHESPSLVGPDRFQEILQTAKVDQLQGTSKLTLKDVKKSEMTGPNVRVSAFLAKQDSVAENCCFGPLTPLEAMLCLVIDDGVKTRGHRRNIFDPRHRLTGVAHGLHRYSGVMTVMNLGPKLEAVHPEMDSLHLLGRRRLTLGDFEGSSEVWDVLKPRVCVGCGGICFNSRRMRKYRGLDAKGQEMEDAFCHPACDLCPQCGEVLEDSGTNLAICFSRHGKTQRVHQRCVAKAFQMYCKVCRAECTDNFLEYNDVNRSALDSVKEQIQERKKGALKEGDMVCKNCLRVLFEDHRLKVKAETSQVSQRNKSRSGSDGSREVCHLCGKGLSGTRRVQLESRWVHETCYHKALEVPCAHCKKTIKTGDPRIAVGKKEVHKRCLEAFYEAHPKVASKLTEVETHQCVYCKSDIGQQEGPTMFQGKWYHKACCDSMFAGYKGPSLNKTCAKCQQEIVISEAILVKERWLHKRCWEDSEVSTCAFCRGAIVEISQKAWLDGKTLHPACVPAFLETGGPIKSSKPKSVGAEVSCCYCGELIVGAVPVLHAEGKMWHQSCRRKSQETICDYCGQMIHDMYDRSEVAGKGVFHHGCVSPYLAAWRQRSRSPRREMAEGAEGYLPSALEDGRELANLLTMSRPQGLLKARAEQLCHCGVLPHRWSLTPFGGLVQAFRSVFQRLCGRTQRRLKRPVPEEASRLLLACWAAVCSWDQGFVAAEAWEQASRSGADALDLVMSVLDEVSSVFGLFALLQVVEMAPENEEQLAVRKAVMKRMQSRLRSSGATCPVCLEELGREPVQLIVMPCSHAVCWSCYASAVRAKACAGRCLMCRKVCNWSNIIISKLREDFGSLMLTMLSEEATALEAHDGHPLEMPPPEFLLASICADLSEHLPYLVEVSMTPSSFTRFFKASSIEISPQGGWIVTEKLELSNSCGRGNLAGLGLEAVAPAKPRSVTLPVASSLVSIATVDGKVSYNEFQLQDAAAFTPSSLFALLDHGGTVLTVWKVPLPMKLLWSPKLREKLEANGLRLSEEMVKELLERPELEIFGRLSMFDDVESDSSWSDV